MSSAVLKKCLQLYEDDLKTDASDPKKKKKSVNEMKITSTKNIGLWKEQRRLQKQQRNQKRKSTKETKSLIEKYRESQQGDFTEYNLTMLQKLSGSGKVEADQAKKILDQHERLHRRGKIKEMKPEEKSVFTDEDFEKFEQEYNFS